MQKKKIAMLLLTFLLAGFTAHAQVQVSNISFNEALQKAKAADKIVLLMIESAECTQCNEVAMQGFANALFGRTVNSSCITIKINAKSTDYKLLDSLYNISNWFGFLFINGDGSFLHKYAASSSYYVTNLQQLDKALSNKEHPDTAFIRLLYDYQNGKRDFETLYTLVAKKNEKQLDHDLLTDEMLDVVPKDSANSLSFLQFIADQAPVLGSPAELYMHKDPRNFHDAWYLMPTQKRVLINNRINFKSKTKAIKEKNLVYAEKVANLTAATYSDRTEARKGYEKTMIDYYKGVKDTTSFLQASVKYCDQYLMNIRVDSVQRVDSIRKQEIFSSSTPEKLFQPGSSPVAGTLVQFAPSTQNYTGQLNEMAWTIYTYTPDPFYTEKALAWAKRATEFFDRPEAMDTYARLLYKAGQKKDAVTWEQKAIQLCKDKKMPLTDYEEVLAKMKSASAAIDKY